MIVLDPAATAHALPYPQLVAQMRKLFAAGMRAPDRHHHTLPIDGEQDGTLLLMPAWDDAIGCVKIVTVTPDNGQRSLPSIAGNVLVFDRSTGVHSAILDGSVLTARRTAAASALAASYLARPSAQNLLIIGSGMVAQELPDAFGSVRDIRRIHIWNKRPSSAERLAKNLRVRGWDAESVTDLSKAVPEADIISTATLATEPLLRGKWLQPGQHLDLIGAFTPEMREADDTALLRSRIFVDTPFTAIEAGELKIPLDQGIITPSDILGDLQDICAGRTKRVDDEEVTLFKTSGNAIMDLSAAIVGMANINHNA